LALHYIGIAERFIEEYDVHIEQQLHIIAQKTKIFIKLGKFDDALQLLDRFETLVKECNSDIAKDHVIEVLLLKASFFNNDLQGTNEKLKASDIYKELIDNYQDSLKIDDLLDILHEYIMIRRYSVGVEEYINMFDALYSNTQVIKENTRIYHKFAIKHMVHSLVLSKLDPETDECDDFFTMLLDRIEESYTLYPYLIENYYNLLFVIELLYARTNKLKNKFSEEKCRQNVVLLKELTEKLNTLSESIFSKDSIEYAMSKFEMARLSDKLSLR
jgi:hypothetical protein